MNYSNIHNSRVLSIGKNRKPKGYLTTIVLVITAFLLLSGVAYLKFKVSAEGGYLNSTEYYRIEDLPDEKLTTKATFTGIKDDWRSGMLQGGFIPGGVFGTDFFDGVGSVPPHGPITFTYEADGTLTEKTRTGYERQAKWLIQPWVPGSSDIDGLLAAYKKDKNFAETTTSFDVLNSFCLDPEHNKDNEKYCVASADMVEYLDATLAADPEYYSKNGTYTALQNPYSYTSSKEGKIIFQGKEEDVKGSTKTGDATFTSSTGASLYKTSKDAEGILSQDPYVSSGNATNYSTSLEIPYTTNSEVNAAFQDKSAQANNGKLANFPNGDQQTNQSITGNLYTSPVVFPNGNRVKFTYSYSVSKAAPLQGLDKKQVLKAKYPDDQCNALHCYELAEGYKKQYILDPSTVDCGKMSESDCAKERQRYENKKAEILGDCGGKQPEILDPGRNIQDGQVCSMDTVKINPEIYDSIKAPIGDAIVSTRLSQSFNNFSSNIRFNALAPALYTPVDVKFNIKSDKNYINVENPTDKQAFLVGGKIMTLQSQMIKSLARNVSSDPIPASLKGTNIFKDAYLTSDDRTIGIGYSTLGSPNSFTEKFGAVYVLDNDEQSFGTIRKDLPDRKLYDFFGQILGKNLWKFGKSSFTSGSKAVFTELKTDQELGGVAVMDAFGDGDTNSLILFSYNEKGELRYSLADNYAKFETDAKKDPELGVTQTGFLGSRTPSTMAGRICTNANKDNPCFDDVFAGYIIATPKNSADVGGFKIVRTLKSEPLVTQPKAPNMLNVDATTTTYKYPSYMMENGNDGKIFTFDDPNNLNGSQRIAVVTPSDETGTGMFYSGTLEATAINWDSMYGPTKPVVKADNTSSKLEFVPGAQFPYRLGNKSEIDFYFDYKTNTNHIVTRFSEDSKNKMVDYEWPDGQIPTTENTKIHNIPVFDTTRLVGAKRSFEGVTYIVTYTDQGRDKPKSTYIYESINGSSYKVYLKDFQADSTTVDGSPYLWDPTKYEDLGYPIPTIFRINENIQFDGFRGIDILFSYPDPRGSKFVFHMTFPYSRTSLFWGKDNSDKYTFAWKANLINGFEPVPLEDYYNDVTSAGGSVNSRAASFGYKLLNISQWKSNGAFEVAAPNIKNGVRYLDNMDLMNPSKQSIQDEFKDVGDNGDITTYAGKSKSVVKNPSGASNIYDKKYCEEKWCVAEKTPYVGDQFVDDCKPGTLRNNLETFFKQYAKNPAPGDFEDICKAASLRKVSMAFLLSIYFQESGMNRGQPYSFGCLIPDIMTDFAGQAQCAANSIANSFNAYTGQPSDKKTLQFKTFENQECIPGSAFSSSMESYTPIDRRRSVAGLNDGSFAEKNSCATGLVVWDTSKANCRGSFEVSTLWPGCFTSESGFGSKVPKGCTTTDTMLDSRSDFRAGLNMGKFLELKDLGAKDSSGNSTGEIQAKLDPRLTLTTSCFGTNSGTSTPSTGTPGGKQTKVIKADVGKEEYIVNATVLDVPYINQELDDAGPQKQNACGAVSTTMIAGYFSKLPKSGKPLADFVAKKETNATLTSSFPNLPTINNSLPCGGIFAITQLGGCSESSANGIRNAINGLGLKALPDIPRSSGDTLFKRIKEQIDVGHPLIYSVNSEIYGSYKGYGFNHIVVIVGYGTDAAGNPYLIINDPYNNRGNGLNASKEIGSGGHFAVYPFDSELTKVFNYMIPVSN